MEVRLGVSLDMALTGAGFDAEHDVLADTGRVMAEAGSIVYGSVLANFAAGGRPDRWLELAESTVRRKGHAVPLVETGRLIAGIRMESGTDYAKVAADAPYAPYHQTGGPGLPARPFMLIQDEDRAAILGAVGRRLTEAV